MKIHVEIFFVETKKLYRYSVSRRFQCHVLVVLPPRLLPEIFTIANEITINQSKLFECNYCII